MTVSMSVRLTLGELVSHSSVTLAMVTALPGRATLADRRLPGDGSLPTGICDIAERDGGVPIYAAVDDVTQLKRFAV